MNKLRLCLFSLALLTISISLPAFAARYGDRIFEASGAEGNLREVRRLLDSGISIESADDAYGATPLIYAAYWGRLDIVKELIRRGANVDAQDDDGWTSLMYAAKWAKDDCVKELLRAGANPNIVAHDGSTALMDAAYIIWGSKTAARELIRAGAHVNAQDNYGLTALIYAAKYGKTATVHDLLQAGANPNLAASDGTTALMKAAEYGAVAAVKALLAAGADARAVNRRGKTALDLCTVAIERENERKHNLSLIRDLEQIQRILTAHNAQLRAAQKPAPAKTKIEHSKPASKPAKKRTTRWARWKAKILKAFGWKK